MVSILPNDARSGMDVLARHVGQGIQNAQPQMYENQRRNMGVNALNNAEKEIASAGNDPYKIALAFAKAGVQAPGLERALGPLIQTAMQNAVTQNAFPNAGGNELPQNGVNPPSQIPQMGNAPQTKSIQAQPQRQGQQKEFATPSPFNIMTAPEIDAESKRYATVTRNPDNYQTRQTQLNNLNSIATTQRETLEDMALKAGIQPHELPRFMEVASKFDPKNPAEWMLEAGREYKKIKSDDKKLERAFIPGIGNALFGVNRPAALKKLQEPIKDLVDAGQEQEVRTFLASEYLSPTEVSTAINPLTPQNLKAINSLPSGDFPFVKEGVEFTSGYPKINERKPKISYEEMLEKDPERIQKQEDELSNFFLNNVNEKTSLLGMREKLAEEKDYDWRQIGPAIRKAQSKGLELSPQQSTEMTDIETQAPLQSLPEMFQSWERFVQKLRGNK